jgi:hypothetical protein
MVIGHREQQAGEQRFAPADGQARNGIGQRDRRDAEQHGWYSHGPGRLAKQHQ